MSLGQRPFFSVVVPVLNGGPVFQHCLEALRGSSFTDWELLIVDDGSDDGSAEVARQHGARALATSGHRGPGAARNLGARAAQGEFLFFLDADCEVHSETLGRAAEILRADSGLDGLFGSYDDLPIDRGTVSQFKNLLHHWVHQQADEEAVTFWAGCGAIRRSTFLRLGGFDAQRYSRPSIEDIELGYRVNDSGGRIRLARDVQVRHHKRWTLPNLIRTDVLARGVPWTELTWERRSGARELNLDLRSRVSVVLTAVLWASLIFVLLDPRLLVITALVALTVIALNWQVCQFFLRRRGPAFCLRATPLLLLYYGYSAAAFIAGSLRYFWRSRRAGHGEGARRPGRVASVDGTERDGRSPESD